jgi:hypothetical protein
VASGAFLGNFIVAPPLNGPVGQLAMPDGSLLVSSWNDSAIYRYDRATGALLGTFTQGGSLNHPNNMVILPVPEPRVALSVSALALAPRMARPRRKRED